MIGSAVTPASLRRQLGAIGLALAIIAAVSIPAGYLFLETSIRPLLIRGAIAAAVGLLLGLGIYLAMRVFPVRILDRTIGRRAT